MGTHTHHDHDHEHGPGCGHTAIRHDGHVDYVHDAHLHHPHAGHVDEHELTSAVPVCGDARPANAGHAPDHVHGVGCEHAAIPHLGHIDYLVEDRMHRRHGPHCDDHGPVELVLRSE